MNDVLGGPERNRITDTTNIGPATLATASCIDALTRAIVQDVQALIELDQQAYVMDTPNLLAVPASLLRQHAGRLATSDQMIAESCIEFMLRGY